MTVAELTGQIQVDVSWKRGLISQVGLKNTRPRNLTQLFVGKPLHKVLDLVPLIYSLCSVAQQVAAYRAAESALGLKASQEAEQVREVLVKAETARELVFRLITEWLPAKAYLASQLVGWFSDIKTELGWALAINPVKQESVALRSYAERLQTLLDRVFDGEHKSGDKTWFNQIVQQMTAEEASVFSEEKGFPVLNDPASALTITKRDTLSWIVQQLNSSHAERFCALPEQEGQCYETTLWTRMAEADAGFTHVSSANPLCARLEAQLAVLHRLPEEMASHQVAKQSGPAAKGVGIVNAARGILIHRIGLAAGRGSDSVVKNYQIVAPTEWNFHPQGTLAQMLTGAKVKQELVEPLVESLIKLVDPCVDWKLNLDTVYA